MAEREKRSSRTRAKAARRARRRSRIGRILPIVLLVVVSYFYYRPLASWVHTRSALSKQEAQVVALQRQKTELDRAVTRASTLPAIARRARRIGLVERGEQLFIIKGIPAWRQTHQDTR